MTGFWLCYNSHKHTLNQDSSLNRIQPHGRFQLLDPSRADIYSILNMISSWDKNQLHPPL
jgi:hypothetical protein